MESVPKQSHPSAAGFGPRRILVRGVNWLGDAVMTTPALIRLRERFPEAHIALLTPEKLRDLWLHHSAVNEVITFAPGETVFAAGRKLRAGRFDLALVFPNSPRAALEVWLSQIPHRIGYARPWRNWFLTQAISSHTAHVRMRKRSTKEINRLISASSATTYRVLPGAHQTHEYLRLTAVLGAHPELVPPRLVVLEDEIKSADDALLSGIRNGWDKAGIAKALMLGICPAAEYGSAKRWPAEKYAEVIRRVGNRYACQWLLFGGEGDRKLGWELSRLAGGGVANLAGQTSLRELMAVLKLCRVLLTNDTGPMHVAAALGTPVVVPFGSTSPELTGPGLPGDPAHRLLKSDAPCSPCFRRTCPIDFRCMTGIGVDRVVEAVLDVVSHNRG